MTDALRLLCVLAHPDDESLGTGGTLARYAAEGIECYVITATRGERGWTGDPSEYPGPVALGKRREGELMAAAKILGVREVSFLDYMDGDLDKANAVEAIGKIARHVRRIQPQVVISFGSDGVYGHPDHIAISQFTGAALVAAADPTYPHSDLPQHRVAKFYHMALIQEQADLYQTTFGSIAMDIDGVLRTANIWPDWSLSAWVDAEAYWATVWKAVLCHQSQLPAYGKLVTFTEEHHRKLWNHQTYYRVYSLVNGGRTLERDLFEGLR